MNNKEIETKNNENTAEISSSNSSEQEHHHHHHHHHGDGTHSHHHHHGKRKDATGDYRKHMFHHVDRMRFIRKWAFIAACTVAGIVTFIAFMLYHLD